MSEIAETSRGRAGETFLQRQVRMLLRADFRRGETISPGSGTVARGDQTLAAYLRAGRKERFFDRAFAFGLGVISLVAGVVTIAVLAVKAPSIQWILLGGACAALILYFGLRQLAGWRCMRRNRDAGRSRR